MASSLDDSPSASRFKIKQNFALLALCFFFFRIFVTGNLSNIFLIQFFVSQFFFLPAAPIILDRRPDFSNVACSPFDPHGKKWIVSLRALVFFVASFFSIPIALPSSLPFQTDAQRLWYCGLRTSFGKSLIDVAR